jgi:myo-inositol-1-phosphate synthase
MLGLTGWYSTNILGNRDGEVLDDPESFKTKEMSKLGALEYILQPHLYPELYKEFSPRRPHQLLPAARRQQRGLGQHRHLWLARLPDAAQGRLPVPGLDLGGADCARPGAVPGSGAARGHGRHAGVAVVLLQDADARVPGLYPEHDLFIQLMKLKNTLRYLVVRNSSRTSARILRLTSA